MSHATDHVPLKHTFDNPPAGVTRFGRPRHIGIDVARALCLIGVVVMNYHGKMNYGSDRRPSTIHLVQRIFDVDTGILTTRFAATFVVVAGIAITFLTDTARISTSARTITDTRLRLVRRGCVLLVSGYFLDFAWPGTILFYYGAYFIVAAVLFRLRSRTLLGLALLITAGATALSSWRNVQLSNGRSTAWLDPHDISTLRDLLLRLFVGYTHPILPWLAFLIVGMVIGRSYARLVDHWKSISLGLVALVAVAYGIVTTVRILDLDREPIAHILVSMHPDDRGVAYVTSTLGIATSTILVISATASRWRESSVIRVLQRAGQMSLSIYLGHVLFYYLVVDWLRWLPSVGLAESLALAMAFWVLAMTAAAWWHHRLGLGPAERIYRWLGG